MHKYVDTHRNDKERNVEDVEQADSGEHLAGTQGFIIQHRVEGERLKETVHKLSF